MKCLNFVCLIAICILFYSPVACEFVDSICSVCNCNSATVNCLGKLKGKTLGNDSFNDAPLDAYTLNLRNNELTSIPSGIFEAMPSLIQIDLSFNQITTIPSGFFAQNASRLEFLDISSNKLSSLPDGAFEGLTQLQELEISLNKLQSSNIGLHAFEPLKNLNLLDISSNPMYTLPSSIRYLTNLKELYSYNSKLTALPAEVFTKLNKLESMEFTENKIKNFPNEIFKSLPKIQFIGFSMNYLEKEPELAAIKEAKNLNKMTLSENAGFICLSFKPNFTTDVEKCEKADKYVVSFIGVDFDEDMLNTLDESIVILRIRNCNISSISENAFARFTELEEIDLSYNKLTQIPEKLFSSNTKLTFLSLSYNKIQSLPGNVLSTLKLLKTLILAGNSLSLENISQPEKLFENQQKLEFLQIEFNNFKEFPQYFFKNLLSLKEIDACNNKIATLEAGVFKNLKALESIDLSENFISSIPENTFKYTNIRSITLLFNHLNDKEIAGKFDSLPNLTNLILTSNPAVTCIDIHNYNPHIGTSPDKCLPKANSSLKFLESPVLETHPTSKKMNKAQIK